MVEQAISSSTYNLSSSLFMQISALLLKGGEEVVLVANIKEQKTSRIKVMLLMKKNGMMKRTP